MKLYEIDEAIMECVDEETGEIMDVDKLEQLAMLRDEKIENFGCWIKNLVAEADAIKAEKDALAAREKTARNKAERLKEFLGYALQGEKFKSPRLSVSFRKVSSVKVDPAVLDELPDEYVKVTKEARKTLLKDALAAGEEIPGVTMESRQSVIIR